MSFFLIVIGPNGRGQALETQISPQTVFLYSVYILVFIACVDDNNNLE